MAEWTMIARRPLEVHGRAVSVGERFTVGLVEGLLLRSRRMGEFVSGREYPRRAPAPPVPAAESPAPESPADGARRPRRYRRRDLEAEE